jgi:hypothetical protein
VLNAVVQQLNRSSSQFRGEVMNIVEFPKALKLPTHIMVQSGNFLSGEHHFAIHVHFTDDSYYNAGVGSSLNLYLVCGRFQKQASIGLQLQGRHLNDPSCALELQYKIQAFVKEIKSLEQFVSKPVMAELSESNQVSALRDASCRAMAAHQNDNGS